MGGEGRAGVTAPTAAQRRVLEALNTGGELVFDTLMVAWTHGGNRLDIRVMDALLRAGFVAPTPLRVATKWTSDGRIYTITPAGRAAVAAPPRRGARGSTRP